MSEEPTIRDVLVAMNKFAGSVDKQFKDIRSEMSFEFKEVRSEMATKTGLKTAIHEIEDRLTTQIDGFIQLHKNLETEFVSLRSRCERMESFMVQVAKKLQLTFIPT